jgi:hypothetical protein
MRTCYLTQETLSRLSSILYFHLPVTLFSGQPHYTEICHHPQTHYNSSNLETMLLYNNEGADDGFNEAADKGPMNSSQAHNRMYGLSRLDSRGLPCRRVNYFEYPRLELRDPRREIKVEWLTDMATILAFNPGEKVATKAVSYHGAEILWAKNTPVHAEDLAYLENVLNNQSSTPWQLLKQVIVPKCKPRILHLAEELAHRFQPIKRADLFNWRDDEPAHCRLRDALIKAGARISSGESDHDMDIMSISEYLDGFVRAAAQLNQSEEFLLPILQTASILLETYGQAGLEIFGREQANALGLLGRYKHAAVQFWRLRRKWRAQR